MIVATNNFLLLHFLPKSAIVFGNMGQKTVHQATNRTPIVKYAKSGYRHGGDTVCGGGSMGYRVKICRFLVNQPMILTPDAVCTKKFFFTQIVLMQYFYIKIQMETANSVGQTHV